MTVFRKPTGQRENQLSRTRSSTKALMEIKIKKHVLLLDRVSDWLKIWTASSSLDIKGNIVIKNSR